MIITFLIFEGPCCRSSVSGAQAHDPSTDPTDPTEQSGSGESKGKKRKSALNLDDIDDPAERRKQRRLAKNRATAAVSRCVLLHTTVNNVPTSLPCPCSGCRSGGCVLSHPMTCLPQHHKWSHCLPI